MTSEKVQREVFGELANNANHPLIIRFQRFPYTQFLDGTVQIFLLANAERGFYGLLQSLEAFWHVGSEVDPNHTALTAGQTL